MQRFLPCITAALAVLLSGCGMESAPINEGEEGVALGPGEDYFLAGSFEVATWADPITDEKNAIAVSMGVGEPAGNVILSFSCTAQYVFSVSVRTGGFRPTRLVEVTWRIDKNPPVHQERWIASEAIVFMSGAEAETFARRLVGGDTLAFRVESGRAHVFGITGAAEALAAIPCATGGGVNY